MFNWIEIIAKQEQYQDLLRQAEKERLIQQVLNSPQKTQRRTHILSWLAHWLVW